MASNIKILNPELGQSGLDAYNILIEEPVGANDEYSCGTSIVDIIKGILLDTPADPDVDYGTYEPFVGVVTFIYTGENVTKVTTVNSIGTKIVDFTYDINDDVTQIDINNYGMSTRKIVFTKDGEGNVLTIIITED